MKLLTRGAWHYAILLIFLFVIASIAAWSTMSYLYENVRSEEYEQVLYMTSFRVWALTMGFMFIAGAFGLWAIQFSAESESRFRISEIVNGMDYLSDALLVLDRKGKISGSNPSLKKLASPDVLLRRTYVREVFPCLSEEDVSLLLDLHGPNEVQKDTLDASGKRTLRFRSETAGGISLILVSDITVMKLLDLRKQQTARLQLIGRIVRGVAHDFNNVLSGISGHASLLPRLTPGTVEMNNSVDTIVHEAERGALLAGHLLEFSRLGLGGKPTDNLGEHVRKASNLIRIGLPAGWNVEVSVGGDFPVVPLSGVQIEQMVLNLGLVAADALGKAGVVRITATRPGQKHLLDVGDEFAAVIIVSAGKSADTIVPEDQIAEMSERTTAEEAGIVQSVVRSLLEEAGGSLDFFSGADRSQLYRIILPYGHIEIGSEESEQLADELLSYVSHWQVLFARAGRDLDFVEENLREMGVKIERVDNIISALARIESSKVWHAIVVEKSLLGEEADGLLRAIIKLCPGSGVVVLCEDPTCESQRLLEDITFLPCRVNAHRIVRSMVEAKGLAARRQ